MCSVCVDLLMLYLKLGFSSKVFSTSHHQSCYGTNCDSKCLFAAWPGLTSAIFMTDGPGRC